MVSVVCNEIYEYNIMFKYNIIFLGFMYVYIIIYI